MLTRAIRIGMAAGALILPAWGAQAAGTYTAQVNYTLHCQGCHLADGSGTPDKVPALKNEVGRFLQVDGGREYLVQVPGTSQSPMSDAEIAGVLNWMLKNFSADQLPAEFIPYTGEEVSKLRPEPLANVSATRERLVAAIE
jgi:mono/diheme cytochrome c family protein